MAFAWNMVGLKMRNFAFIPSMTGRYGTFLLVCMYFGPAIVDKNNRQTRERIKEKLKKM